MTFLSMLALALLACGPDLTAPGSPSISGVWFSSDTAASVTDFELQLVQDSDGMISGSWSGTGVKSGGACPSEIGCAPSSAVVGSNTVFQVHIDLVGVGVFTGQVEDGGSMRGYLAGAPLTLHRAVILDGARLSRRLR